MNNNNMVCMKCRSQVDTESRFCSFCGSNLIFQKKISSTKLKISFRWIIFSVISIFIFEYIFATIAGQLFILISGNTSIELETSILVSSIGSLTGIYSGTLYSAYMSPGFSIKEPLIGASIEILVSQLILFVLAGTFSYFFIIRVIIIMTIAFAGAKSGDMLHKKIYRY
ncbi:MAG TPA: hypothetical protein PKG60_14575 [Spirochaetota bacterium]|nr:hypothetical protein [Spirochaetota bacterium]HPS87766.1 hypothetical protein [Spirochaetota bacterium]